VMGKGNICTRRDDFDAFRSILLEHWEDLAKGNLGRISRALHISTADVRRHLAVIAKLRPYPLSGFGNSTVHYIIPDMVFRKDETGWSVLVNDGFCRRYGVNEYYLSLMKQGRDQDLVQMLKTKHERVKFLLNSITQRHSTLYAVGKAVLQIQKDYFEQYGALVPMSLSDVAELTGRHVSTVSRAVRGKILQHPGGTLPLKDLFVRNVKAGRKKEENDAETGRVSGGIGVSQVKKRLLELVQSEDRKKPLSDAKIAELLGAEGLSVSRRTAAKYREELGIPGSFNRRTE